VRSQLSPDGKTLAVLFLYDVSLGSVPVLTQVLQQTNALVGLVFSPDGGTLHGGRAADDFTTTT
jgi:hypothetical protein